jgi:hypothetical protein
MHSLRRPGQPLEVNAMFRRLLMRTAISLVVSMAPAICISAQQPSSSSAPASTLPPQESANSVALASNGAQVAVPTGTRLPLLLRNGINTRTAKAGDSVYFETAYPIARNNRIVIPMGSFVRGQILEAKRPGRIRGRGEFRIALEQMTLPNGYTIELKATPSSVDRDGKEGVTPEGVVTGPDAVDKDVKTVLLATAIGGPVGGYASLLAGSPSRASLVIGHGAGAAAGLLAVLLTRGPEAELPRGTTLDVVLDHALLLDAEHLPPNDPANFRNHLCLLSLIRSPAAASALQGERGLDFRSRYFVFSLKPRTIEGISPSRFTRAFSSLPQSFPLEIASG